MVILHLRWPPKECICVTPPLPLPLPLHLLLLFISSLLFSFCHVLCYFCSTCFPTSSASLASCSSSLFPPFLLPLPLTLSPPPPTLCAPFPPTHQSLALASPLRTYGMMDRRASGASKAKGHLPGALHCRGALGPAMQPRPHTSVSRHSHTQHAHSNTYYRIGYLTLAPLTFIAASHHVEGFVFLMI